MSLIQKIFGTHSENELKRIYPIADAIEALEPVMQKLTDSELKEKTREFKKRLAEGETLDDILPEAYAVVREAAVRTLGMKHYRVQLIGGIILHQGRIAEMKTGEGKTLVSTLPAYLNALAGEGVHIVTVNDYLAKRDAEWMGQVHEFLGLTVGVVLNSMDNDERRAAYNCDITYVTNNELGFDYLRDNMVIYKEQLVQRGLKFAIIDEVDSVLIDEARTPLIISGQSGKSTKLYEACDILARQLERGEASGEFSKMNAIMGEDIEETGDFIVNEKEKNINIPWNYTSLSIAINLNEKDVFRKALFRYSISGLNNQYIESYNHKLELPSLNPGSYSILVSCNTKSGIWSQPIKIATLHITPPWYKSNWFISSMILLFLTLLSGIVYLIIRKKENKLKWEMKEHEQTVNEEKIRFLVNISHELRTPLTLIYAPLKRLIDRSNDKLKPELIKDQLNSIYKQTRQMKNIINMVLDLNRIKTGEEPLQKLPHTLNEWVRSVSEDFRNEYEEKKINLQYELDDSIEYIWFDEWKCQIILSNLLMNALKFSDQQTEITISTQRMNNFVRISVKDQGIGLQNVDSGRLFSRFYQGEHNKSGSGIGLSYAKILIEMHGGNIGAYNNTDKGATFYYELPILTDTSLPEEMMNDNNSENIPIPLDISAINVSCSNYSLLIVEDKQELRMFLKDSFKDVFNHIYTAEDGMTALDLIKTRQPDIIVSDVMMPRMDGYELCRHIKEDVEISHIPIILLTAKCDQDSTSTGYKLGADFYLSKPFELDFLLTIIVNLLKSREAIKQKYKERATTILPQDSTISNADETFLVKLNNLIYTNLSNPDLDVKFLMGNMAMSRASLYNKVKALTDMGVNDYINKLRIEKASSMLIHTDLSISEISFEVGFTYQRYFSTIFKQIKGVTPSQFKEENKNNNNIVQQELR